MKKIINTLGIDRGSKYIGLATMGENTNIAMPIGYLLNDQMIYFNISDIITRNYVKKIVIGYPSKQKDIQEKINKFMQSLEYIIDKSEISIEKIDEDYSSVQSGEIVSNFKKNVAEDTVSAMIILERRSEKRNS
ncbi:MAG TPA: Holliday junction resolvase RuvX [Candidatus Absconditabacterales bacterium]|nr:Holliday junction resolvase RuvX [Candidatus Absconditabacterales bacterium]HMT27244.1 Holliday junction resolvase RuvX [Candidatus Absconditabacterales bacterium]